MTDLEQLRPYFDPHSRKKANEILDAHLEEDAERDFRIKNCEESTQARVVERQQDELARLREELKYAQGGQYVAVMQENARLREALDRHHHDSCIQELQDAVMEAETRANDRGAELARLREALTAIANDTDMFGKHPNSVVHDFARNALKETT